MQQELRDGLYPMRKLKQTFANGQGCSGDTLLAERNASLSQATASVTGVLSKSKSPYTKVPGDPQRTAAQGGGELVDKTTQPLPEETRRGPSLPSPGKDADDVEDDSSELELQSVCGT